MVTEDSALAALFPHEVISHLAWIDAGGRVKAITTPQYVNAGNIDRVLNNEAVRWPVKKDILHFDRNIPLLEIYGNRPEYYSTLTGYIDGVPGVQAGFSTDSLRNTVRCFAFNRDVISLYKMTIYQGELAPNIPSGRLVKLETNDSSRFFYMDPSVYKDAWKSSNQYCYESVLPLSTPRQAVLQAMRADLNKFLGLNGRLEPVKVPVLVLTGAFNGKATDTGKEDRPLILIGPGAPDKYVRNARIPAVVNALNVQGTLPVIIDETGYGGLVSFDFGPIDISDYQAVKKVLESYGFHLSKAERYLDHLVITEPGYHIEKPR